MTIEPIQLPNQEYYYRDTYICTVDLDQKSKHNFTGDNGKEFTLFIPATQVKNHRLAHPNYATIETATLGSQFKKGDGLVTLHFTFEDEAFRPKVYYNQDGTDYFKVQNVDVIAGVVNEKLIPREGILFCKPVTGKLLNTQLEMLDKYAGKRRDIAIVDNVWEGCTKYRKGDYLILNKGADYYFDWQGTEYMKVDTYFDDVLAKVDSEQWRVDEERLHATHGEITELY